MNILACKDISLDAIKLGKIYTYHSSNQLCNLYYNNEPFYIHTPALYIPYGVLYFQNSSKPVLEMTTANEKFDIGITQFKEVIKRMELHCLALYKDLYAKQVGKPLEKELEITSLVKKVYMREENKFLIPINKEASKCILVEYPSKKKRFILDWDIKKPTYGIAVVQMRNFWVRDGKCGVNWVLEHVQIMPSHILDWQFNCQSTEASAITESLPTSAILEKNQLMEVRLLENDPVYGVYFKMRKMGIPLEAVQNKMRMSGHNPEVLMQNGKLAVQIAYQQIQTATCTIPLPPPPPQSPIHAIKSLANSLDSQATQLQTQQPRNAILSQIASGGFQLKKVSAEGLSAKKKIYKKHDLNVPSLDDILGGLSRLKKNVKSFK